ncbi:MAG: hypothetical protein CVU39_26475 [Chloroflexi bacterium HGW-Chloroflexi-10]|nr:MAG: hypothetical protein CVU39_26475 [Chloroflexi bacterium HGW-Chloroflexi-10]
MSAEKDKGQRYPLIGVFISVIITFSMLLVFSERISSKPTEAGFWMILVFGVSLGVAITMTVMQVFKKNK